MSLRLAALTVAVLSLIADLVIFLVADYDIGHLAPPRYLAREPVLEALTFPSLAYLAVLAAPAVALAAAVGSAITSWMKAGRHAARRGPPLVTIAVAAASSLGLVPIADILDQSGETTLLGVAMSSAGSGWAVGSYDFERGGAVGVIWRYDGTGWREVARPASGLRAVAALPDGEAWAVGDGGTILHELGGRWESVASGTTDELSGIAMGSPVEGWAVGGYIPFLPAAAIEGGAAPLRSPPGARCTLLHFFGGRWSSVGCPLRRPLTGVAALPDGEAWAIGDGALLHEMGGRWTQVAAPAGLTALAMTSAGGGWAAGRTGGIARYRDGTWTAVPPASAARATAIVTSPTGDEGWVAGANLILRLRGGAWLRAYRGDQADDLYDVALAPGTGDAGWAVGAGPGGRPLILELRNGSWRAYPTS